ncbi:MAG: DegQ family serine endoprotease [Pseudomonadota bacterium]
MNDLNLKTATVALVFALASISSTAANSRGLPNFIDLVEDNRSAVVNISTVRASRQQITPSLPPGLEIPDLENSPFGDLLRKFFEERGQMPPPGREEAASLGSGFIISDDGYVLTNNHVIDGAEEIIVRLHDRRQLVAELVGRDERSDIALLKLDADDLPTVKIGESDALKVGEWVLAIGSPFGFDHSVTAGIVSAKGRALPSENYTPFIQTDVAINPGNSGGPLFNLDGEVVGINSQIYSRTGGFMGLSFAIPIELAINVVDQIKTKGRVSRGWLGVIIQEVTRSLAESFGMERAHGALISQILSDSPAENSELKVGDIIIEFNGDPVERSSSLPPLVGRAAVDEYAKVIVMRDGERVRLSVKIGELPDTAGIAARATQAAPKTTGEVTSDTLGLTVVPPDDASREKLGIDSGGAMVSEIENGPAQQAGLIEGDLIVSLNGIDIESTEQFGNIASKLESGKSVAVLVQREQGPIFLAIKIPE